MTIEETELREVNNEEEKQEDLKARRSKKGQRRKTRTRGSKLEETDLNNAGGKKENVGKSDTENEDRIKNDISEQPAREKNTNIVKERRRKRGVEREKRKTKNEEKAKSPVRSEQKLVDPNVARAERNHVIGVFIHESEVLELDFLVCHPVVKVSIVDGASGHLLNKSAPDRRVTSFYENEAVTKILPLMTQPFDFKQKQSIVPKWEELLLFNDNFDDTFAAEKNKNVVMFFEILDFLPMTVASKNFRRQGQSGGWYRIAWAFLKLVDEDWRSTRFGWRSRLQLYKPGGVREARLEPDRQEDSREVWRWWRSDRRLKYPGTVWVTVEPVTPPDSSQPALRSMAATQPEEGQTVGGQSGAEVRGGEEGEAGPGVVWSRLPGQACRIPASLATSLDTATRGVSALAFSTDGRRLAVAAVNQTTSTVRIYDFPSAIFLTSLSELYGMVYELSFHPDGLMLAAVGDGSCMVWSSSSWKLEEKLAHPSYVYSAQFHPATSSLVATGGFDRVVRIWRREEAGGYRVSQELTGHNHHINCLKFDIEGHFLFSADNKGLIKMWESPESHHNLGLESSTDSFAHLKLKTWSAKREYRLDCDSDSPICQLSPHPGGRRLLVHRLHPSSALAMLDLRTGGLMQTYPDIDNFRLPAPSCISPCGSWVIGGSDCGVAICWNTDTGEKAHIFRDLNTDKQLSAIAFHPHEHALVLGSVEPHGKVGVYIYDRKGGAGEERQGGREEREEAGGGRTEQPGYPSTQVARLIQDRAQPGQDREELRTPVDLQDIVEKLNSAIKDCRMKNNLTLGQISPEHGQLDHQ